MEPVSIRRSALRMWVVSLIGVPLIVVAVDVLLSRRLSTGLLELLYTGDTLDQLFEGREILWAVVMGVVGLGMTGFGLKELLAPRAVLKTSPEGLHLKIQGPQRPDFVIPWSELHDIRGVEGNDEGDKVRLLEIEVKNGSTLPSNPWGARIAYGKVLQLLANDWEKRPEQVAEEVTQYAVSLARQGTLTQPIS